MIATAGTRAARPSFFYVYVGDTDTTYRRALDAGATSVEEPLDTPYGDRRATIEDRWRNVWQIAIYQRR
jgi:PhnB protein